MAERAPRELKRERRYKVRGGVESVNPEIKATNRDISSQGALNECHWNGGALTSVFSFAGDSRLNAPRRVVALVGCLFVASSASGALMTALLGCFLTSWIPEALSARGTLVHAGNVCTCVFLRALVAHAMGFQGNSELSRNMWRLFGKLAVPRKCQ